MGIGCFERVVCKNTTLRQDSPSSDSLVNDPNSLVGLDRLDFVSPRGTHAIESL